MYLKKTYLVCLPDINSTNILNHKFLNNFNSFPADFINNEQNCINNQKTSPTLNRQNEFSSISQKFKTDFFSKKSLRTNKLCLFIK